MVSSKSSQFSLQNLYGLALVLLHLCVAIHGGGRRYSRYREVWNEPYPGSLHDQEGPGANPRFDLETGLAVKKALGLTKIIFSPFLVPVVVPAILFVGIVLLLFFAVVGSATVAGGALGRRVPYQHVFAKQLSSTAKLASDVLTSKECVERISCEMYRTAKGHQAENWILSALETLPLPTNWFERISRSMKTSPEKCQEFNCPSVSRISKVIKHFY